MWFALPCPCGLRFGKAVRACASCGEVRAPRGSRLSAIQAVEERRHSALYDLILPHSEHASLGFRNMNERAQACLLKAVECEHAARHSKDESVRLLYLDLAKQWRTLAEHVETRSPASQL